MQQSVNAKCGTHVDNGAMVKVAPMELKDSGGCRRADGDPSSNLGLDTREGPADVAPVTTSRRTWSEPGGRHAGLRFSVCEMQCAVREDDDGCAAGKGETRLPRVQGP